MKDNSDFFVFIIGIAFILGFTAGLWYGNKAWEESAVKAGAGEYNSKTSKFQWAN